MLFQNFVGNSRLAAGLAQDRRVGAAVDQNAGQRDLESRHPLHARGNRVEVHAVAAAHQRAVDVEEIRVLPVPREIPAQFATRASLFCCVFCMIRAARFQPWR